MRISNRLNGSIVVAATVFVLSLAISGCSEFRDDWGDETTQATAVGGVMGAGLGAIIGSQTGSAGAGLAIGGVTGAGVGAAIGTSLQERSDNLRAQEELIERQEQRIAANRKSLEQLNASRDSGVSDRLAYGQMENSGSYQRYDTNQRGVASTPFRSPAVEKRAQDWKEAESSRARFTEPRAVQPRAVQPSAVQPRAGISESSAPEATSSYGVTTPDNTYVEEATPLTSVPVGALAEREISGGSGYDNSAIATEGNNFDSNIMGLTDAVPNQPSTGAIVTGIEPRNVLDDDCLIAEGELNLADNASAAADKLFHQRKALRLCPNTARYHIAIAETYASLNRNSDAEFELREALKFEPQNEEAQLKLKGLR